jgi:hypothetical protein
MTHPYYHAESSARKFGGKPEDYLAIHQWLDETKESFCDFRHRAVRHHAEGIFEAEEKFGITITNSDGKKIPVRYVGEQHVMEDCGGRVPNRADWLSKITPEIWMSRGTFIGEKINDDKTIDNPSSLENHHE